MKKTTLLLTILVLCAGAWAAGNAAVGARPTANHQSPVAGHQALGAITIPQMLSYQGKLTDTLGVPVPNGNYQLTFRLYTQPTGGSAVWTEGQTILVKNGLFAALLGAVTPITSLPESGACYLSLQVAANPELSPRQRIVSAAYSYLAARAANSDLLQGKDTTALDSRYVNEGQASSVTSNMIVDGTIAAADLGQMGASSGQVMKWTGSAWAPRNDSIGSGGGGTVTSVSQATGVVCVPNPITTTGTVGFDSTWGDARFVNEAQAAGGGLTGTYPNPTIGANAVSSANVTDGSLTSADIRDTTVNTADLKDAAVTMPKLNQAGAGTGQVIKWTGSAWAPGNDSSGVGTTRKVVQATGIVCTPNPITDSGTVGFDSTWGDARFVNEAQANSITGAMITDGQVSSADIRDTTVNTGDLKDAAVTMPKLNQAGATSGQVIKWTGSAWAPGNDSSGAGTMRKVVQATGIVCSPNPITDSGTVRFDSTWGDARFVNENQSAGGDLTGTYPSPTLANSGVSAGTYGSATQVGQFSVDTKGRLTSAGNVSISGVPPGGAAGGGLAGTYPNPTIATDAVSSGNIIDGSVASADIRDTTVTTADLKDDAVTSDKILDAAVTSADIRDTTVNTAELKDAAVTMPKLNQAGATAGQVIKWAGSSWAPANDSVGSGGNGTVRKVFQSTGVVCSPNPITDSGTVRFDTAWGDARFVNEAQAAGGGLTGNYPNPTIAADAVASSNIVDGSVTSAEIRDTTITGAKLKDDAVTSAKVLDGAITSTDIRDTTVNTSELKDAAVTAPKLNQMGATTNQVLKWTGSAWAPGNDSIGGGGGTVRKVVQAAGIICSPNPITDSGTVQFDSTWGDARFVNEGQSAGGGLTGTYPSPTIANNAVGSAQITDGSVTSADIRDTTVNTAELKDGAVTSAKILDANVTSTHIRDTTVNTADMKDAAVTAPKLNQMGATANQVLKWTGSAWAPRNDSLGGGGGDSAWVRGTPDSVLFTIRQLGIARGGASNMLHGTNRFTHVTLGVACTTGTSGQNYSYATVGGGNANVASGGSATIGGGTGNTASGSSATVSGGSDNIASATQATVAGGSDNAASGYRATVSGGGFNAASGYQAAVGGGFYDVASDTSTAVGGGKFNVASGTYAAVSGGNGDTAKARYGGVLSGYSNLAGDAAEDTGAAVVGGWNNAATNKYSFVGGGQHNLASGSLSTVAGGYADSAMAAGACVGGGQSNVVNGNYGTVAGGHNNRAYSNCAVGGGESNYASSSYATVGGGSGNSASGIYSCVPGGLGDTVSGDYGFAANSNSNTAHSGSAAFNGQATTASSQTRVGILSKASGSFTIDHPLDPAGRILNHYFIEGPEMLNIYRGSAKLDGTGRAVVSLPDYFDALNRNPMVQLTGVGTSEVVYVAEKVRSNRFVIGGPAGAEVYWQVSAERKDVSAEATRRMMPVEQPKTGVLAGRMLDDDFLSGCMDQLVREGKAQGIDFRTAGGRARYEKMRQHLREAGQQ
jgi:hypothetical protein